jgi:hypothetical protein
MHNKPLRLRCFRSSSRRALIIIRRRRNIFKMEERNKSILPFNKNNGYTFSDVLYLITTGQATYLY